MTDHDHIQEQLQALILSGRPLPPDLEAHLAGCPDCAEEARSLRELAQALLHAAPEVAPPPALRAAVLQHAQPATLKPGPAPPRRRPRWPALIGLAAAVAGALLLLPRQSALASALRDPAVVVADGPRLLVANNGPGRAPLALVHGDRVRTIALESPTAPWFTEGVRDGGRVYLADAANDRVLEIDLAAARLVRSVPAPGGVAGLSVQGGRVIVKCVNGMVGPLGGPHLGPAGPAGMPLEDVMDAALLAHGRLYATQHTRGELLLLSPDGLTLQGRVRVGRAPVALAQTQAGVLVLDHAGALYALDGRGRVLRRYALGGHPDKLALNDRTAYASDRAGRVSRIDLVSGRLLSKQFAQPMDLAPMDDGHLALADGRGGLKILDAQLNVMKSLGGQ